MRSAVLRAARHAFVLVPFAFYFATASRSIGGADSAILMDSIAEVRLSTLVNNHNLTVLVGALFTRLPGDDAALEANLMSATVGALAIAAFYALVFRCFGSVLVAAVSSAALMVSHSMWWHSTIAESYAMNALFTVAAIGLLAGLRHHYRDRSLYELFALSGLALFNHVQLGILAVGAAVFLAARGIALVREGRGGEWAALAARCAVSFLVGLLPYLVTFAVDVRRSGTFAGTLRWATGGSFQEVMFQGSAASGLRDLATLAVQQFPSPFLLAVLWGVVLLVRRWGRSPSLAALAAMFLLNSGFFMFYNTWDKFAFLLPGFVMLAFCGAFAVDAAVRWLSRERRVAATALALAAFAFTLCFPVFLYAHLAEWGRGSGFWYHDFDDRPTRNTDDRAEYLANPNKRDFDDVESFVRLLLERLPERAIYIDSDFHHYFEVEFFQRHLGLRSDLKLLLVNSWRFEGWGLDEERFRAQLERALERGRPLFLVSVGDPFARFIVADWPERKFRFVRFPLDEKRWVYRLVDEAEAAASLTGSTPEARLHDLSREDVVSQFSLHLVEDQPMYAFGDAWKNYDHVFVRANHPGPTVSFRFPAEEGGAATLGLGVTTADNFGIVDIELNGRPLARDVDLYAPELGVTRLEYPGVELEAGDNVVSFRITGKNPRSLSYRIGVDWVEIRPPPRAAERGQTRGNRGGRFSRKEATPSPKSFRPKLSSIRRTAFSWAAPRGSSSAS